MVENSNSIITFVDVWKSFDSQNVFCGVNLKIYSGKITVILGESGTGKSVLLKHIVGLIKPDRGKVFVGGEEITQMGEQELAQVRIRFGFLFQGGALFDSLSAGDNVAFPLRQHTNLSEDQIREKVREKLRLVGLEDVVDKFPAELSGGQKKRVALARAIALDPEIVLYDEPTTGLDPIRADIINELILRLNRKLGITSVVVTHDIKSAYKIADRLLLLHRGNFIFDGSVDEIRAVKDDRVRRFLEGRADESELKVLI